jgi:hypothetical protein
MNRVSRGALLLLAVAGMILPTTTPAVAEVSDPPAIGQCTNDASMDSWAHVGSVVDCEGLHTGQTVWVGTWPLTVSPAGATAFTVGGPEDVALRQQLQPDFDACSAAMASLIGGARKGYQIPNEFTTNYVGPNDAEWAAGQRWARCDVVASAPLDRTDVWSVKPLPSPQALSGIMNTRLMSNPYRLCYWSNPSGYGFIDCASAYVAYDLPATYAGRDLHWPGSARDLLLKVRVKCRANPAVRSFGALPGAVHATSDATGRLTKANYRASTFYCMVKR